MLDQLDWERVKQNATEEAQRLAGFDDVDNADVFHCEQFQTHHQRLAAWMKRQKLKVSETHACEDAFRFEFDETYALQFVDLLSYCSFAVLIFVVRGEHIGRAWCREGVCMD